MNPSRTRFQLIGPSLAVGGCNYIKQATSLTPPFSPPPVQPCSFNFL